MGRINLYLLLELDPSEQDPGRIEQAIRNKRAEWSRQLTHPTRGRQAQKSLDELKHQDVQNAITDPITRAEHAREAAKIRKDAQREAARELDEAIEIVAASGYVMEDQVTNLVARFKNTFSEVEIRKRIAVPIRSKSTSRPPAKPMLVKSLAQGIVRVLTLIGKKDLYDFLGPPLSRRSSLKALLDRTKEVDAEVRRINNKDAIVTARGELIGHCLNSFGSNEEKTKYDNTLDQQSLIELDPLIEASCSSETAMLSAAVLEKLERKAAQKGVDVEEARRYIIEFASERKWSVQVPAVSVNAKLQRCGSCGIVNEEKANACSSCGESLSVECPKCNAVNPSDHQACSRCGFSTGDAPLVRRLVHDSDLAQARGDTSVAEQLLRQANVYWPGFNGIQERLANIEKISQEKQRAFDDIQKTIQEHNLQEAQTFILEFKRKYHGHLELEKVESAIAEGMARAKKLVEVARAFENVGRFDDAIDAYGGALRECHDLCDAREGLGKWPPACPGKAWAKATSIAIQLQWEASQSKGNLLYHVIRKIGSEPRSSRDGEIVATQPGVSITDHVALPGEKYFYAVYADRGGIVSREAAFAGPVLRTGEVTSLAESAGDGCVSLSWQQPPRTRRIEVWRKTGNPPVRQGDGERLTTATLNSVTDAGLKNGTTYGFRVIAVFDGVDGRPVYSEGVTVTALPVKLPPPISDLAVVRRDEDFEATWSPPEVGQVQLYACDQRPNCRCGQILPVSVLGGFGKLIPGRGPGCARGKIAKDGVLHLLPVSVMGFTGVVGQSVSMTWVNDVDHLAVTVEREKLVARWWWPKDIETAWIVWREDQFPSGPEDSKARREACVRFQYDQHGGFEKKISAQSRMFVAVYAATKRSGEWCYASGATPGSRKEVFLNRAGRVSYRVFPKKSLGFLKTGEHLLEISSDGFLELPELVLVAKSGGIPLNSKNGTIVLRIPLGTHCSPDKPVVRPFRANGVDAHWKARLFPSDETQGDGLSFVNEN